MSDQEVRSLERRVAAGDAETRSRLVLEYMRQKQGRCLFWIDEDPGHGAISCEMNFGIGDEGAPSVSRTYWLLPIVGLDDVEEFLKLHPNGILNLATDEQSWFHSPYKAGIPRRRGGRIGLDETIIHDGLYEVKTFEAGSYSERSPKLWFFQDYPDSNYQFSDDEPRTICVRSRTNRSDYDHPRYAPMGQRVVIPYPRSYFVTGISLVPMPGTHTKSYRELIGKTRFRFNVGIRSHVFMPTIRVAGGIGGGDLRSKISAPMAPILTLPEPVELIPQQDFYLELVPFEPFTLKEPVKVFLNLHGNYVREVM